MLSRVLHTGIAVDDLEKSIELYESLGFSVMNKFHKPDPSAEVATVQKGETEFELWQFNDKSHSQVTYIHSHVAIYSDALEEDLKSLEAQGYKLVIPITDGVKLRYAFVQDRAGATYEIATNKSS